MRLCLLQFAAVAVAAVCVGAPNAVAQAAVQNSTIAGTVSPLLLTATDLGAHARLAAGDGVVLQLATTPAQQSALAQFLSAVVNPSSAQYHQWLTPVQFADQFGASAANVSALTAWLGSQGLQVTYSAQSNGFVLVSGTAAQIEAAFGVQLDNFQLANGSSGFANTADPVLPASIAALVAKIRGLNSFMYTPAASSLAALASGDASSLDASSVNAQGLTGAGVGLMLANADQASAAAAVAPAAGVSDGGSLSADPLLAAALGVDGDSVPVMVVSGGCASSLTIDDMSWFESVAEQANAQGVTLVADTADCATGPAFPAILSEVTAVGQASTPEPAPAAYPVPRPWWQTEAGLPADGLRYTPDLSVSGGAGDAAAFAAALTLVVQKGNGARQGNVNSILYSLASDPGVYTAAATSSTGLFVSLDAGSASGDTSGLGVPDLSPMIQFWPLGGTASNTSLTSTNYAPTHGQSITLTATVTTGATGTVTFSAGSTVLGSPSLSQGTPNVATQTESTLAGGTYTMSAVYNGDNTYASSSGTATVTVLPEAATITATPAGTPTIGTAFTVNVTVSGTSGVGNPTGTITVTPQGVSNSTVGHGTLSASSSGSSTATASLEIGQAGTFTLTTSCISGDQSFSCSTPASTQVTVAAGTSTTALVISPNPPTPGQSITETATVTPSVSGTNIISPTGTVTFYDGTSSLGTGSLTCTGSTCTATFTTTLSPGKTHSLTAKYARRYELRRKYILCRERGRRNA